MDISIIGTGYIGLITGAVLAQEHNVTCIDTDAAKMKNLSQGITPMYEPHLETFLTQALDNKHIKFSTDIKLVKQSQVIMICVGTPCLIDGSANLQDLHTVFDDIYPLLDNHIIILRSTVPPGTCASLIKQYDLTKSQSVLIFMPEFLAEGTAIRDADSPNRLVFGGDRESISQIEKVFPRNPDTPVIYTDHVTAEIAKYASNCFLATKISYINNMANLCEAIGGNIEDIAYAMGCDRRIGSEFLQSGLGWGGSCLPKDLTVFTNLLQDNQVPTALLASVKSINDQCINRVLALLPKDNRDITILGAAFKEGTTDLRKSPGLKLAKAIKNLGYQVQFYDPLVQVPEFPNFASFKDAVYDSSVLIITTKDVVFDDILQLSISHNLTIIDTRRLFIAYRSSFPVNVKYFALGDSLQGC